MKNFALLLLMLLPVGMYAQVDDMYFVPKKKAKTTVVDNGSVTFSSQESFHVSGETMDVDAYNRRYSDGDNYEYEGDDVQYSDYSDDADYVYSSRIVRFHSPRRVMLSSPLYWDVVYIGGGSNWVIYDDGIYWDYYPTYSSWYYPSWSWSYSIFSPYYYGWNSYWHHHNYHYSWWHHNHYHNSCWPGYYPHWGGSHHHMAGGGPSYRDNRRPAFTDMRSGTTVGRGISRSANVNKNNGSTRRQNVSGSSNSGTRRQNVSDSRNSNGSTRQKTETKKDSDNRREKVERSKSNSSKEYSRPSSTRSTNSNRSSSSNSNFGSGSSRGSFGSGSTGGGSRSSGGGGGSRGGGGGRR